MTAQEVFNSVEAYAPGASKTTCDLNGRCSSNRQCATPQTTLMVDFDPVKTKWNTSHRQSSMSSVDGLVCNYDVLCFVEIKSTVNFTNFQIHSDMTDAENLGNINKQMAHYSTSLQKKLIDSITICQGITGNSRFTDGMNIRYVLVTDVDLSPLANLSTQLSLLATGSSNWDVVYASMLGLTFNQSTVNLSGITTEYKSCMEMDNYLQEL